MQVVFERFKKYAVAFGVMESDGTMRNAPGIGYTSTVELVDTGRRRTTTTTTTTTGSGGPEDVIRRGRRGRSSRRNGRERKEVTGERGRGRRRIRTCS